ncbi:MAG TPA: ABC transporter ATP-binding protein [Ktedonobacterales bacterium]
MTTPPPTLLAVRALTVRFGGVVAINALDMDVPEGHIFALVGPNGAGKTTLLNCISGFVQPSSGDILFAGESLLPMGCHRRAGRGIARTFQNVQLFASMSVLDNLVTAQHSHLRAGLLTGMLPLGPSPREDRRARAQARETLALLGLEAYADTLAGALPFGVQKMVGVARALVLRPRLLLLDEPAAGMPHTEVEQMAASLRRWRAELGTTLLLIEHNMPLVQAVADTVCVLDYGRKLAEGAPQSVLTNPAVLEAYLGRGGTMTGNTTGNTTTGTEGAHAAG